MQTVDTILRRKEFTKIIDPTTLTTKHRKEIACILERQTMLSSTQIKVLANMIKHHPITSDIGDKFGRYIDFTTNNPKLKYAHTSEIYEIKFGNVNGPILLEIHRRKNLHSEEIYILRHGKSLGQLKWKEFKNKCIKNRTLERQIELHGSDKGNDRWNTITNKFHKWGTLDYFIARHGKDKGKEIYDKKISALRLGSSVEGFKAKYGEDWKQKLVECKSNNSKSTLIRKLGKLNGTVRYRQLCEQSRIRNTEAYYIQKHGSVVGPEKYQAWKQKSAISFPRKYSHISQQLFDDVRLTTNLANCQYATFGGEYRISLGDKFTYADFIDHNTRRIIEFYGDFWHASPRGCSPTIIPIKHLGLTSQQIWNRDKQRITELNNIGYETLVVWEQDYNADKQQITNQCIKFLTT